MKSQACVFFPRLNMMVHDVPIVVHEKRNSLGYMDMNGTRFPIRLMQDNIWELILPEEISELYNMCEMFNYEQKEEQEDQ